MSKNKFVIAIEGLDGSGKTTQVEMLFEYLTKKGLNCRVIGFSSSSVSNHREMMKELSVFFESNIGGNNAMFTSAMQIYELMRAYIENIYSDDRLEIIIADRYIYAMEMLINAKHSGVELLDRFQKVVLSWLPKPDIVFYVDINVSTARSRILSRQIEIRKHESEEILTSTLSLYSKIFSVIDCEFHSISGLEKKETLHKFIAEKVDVSLQNSDFSNKLRSGLYV